MKKRKYSSVENALRLLNMFTVEKSEYRINELAEQLSIAQSTVHRLLTTLSSEGFIAKDSLSNKYRLGISIRALESVVTKDMDLFHLSQDIIEENVLHTNLSTSLAIIFRETTFYLHAIEVENPLFNKLSYIGKQCSFLSTSAGHVLLFSMKDADILTFIQDPSTVNILRNQLHTNGYIHSNHDHPFGLSTIAVPIKNKKNEIIAALEMIGNERQLQTYVETLKNAGIKLSNKLKNH